MNANGSAARDWALSIERDRTETPYQAIARVVDLDLFQAAHAYACRIVGAGDAGDATSTTWVKVLADFDPARGGFRAFYFTVLRTTCLDLLKARKTAPQLWPDVTAWPDQAAGDVSAVPADATDDLIARLDDLGDRIEAALDLLDLTGTQREVLRRLFRTDTPDLPADLKTTAARQQRRRARARLDELAGFTPDEAAAVALVRTHRTVAAAAAAAPGTDLPARYAAAKRKAYKLLGLDTGEAAK